MDKFYFVFESSKGSKDLVYISNSEFAACNNALEWSKCSEFFTYRVYVTDHCTFINVSRMRPIAIYRYGVKKGL